MKSCLVLCSGGIDSVTVAARLRHEQWSIFLHHVDYGQMTADSEREAVRQYATSADFPSPILTDLRQIGVWGDGFLVGRGEAADGPAAEEFPNRNLFLVGAGAVVAARLGCQAVALGIIDASQAYYADCRPAFQQACRKTLQALSPALELLTPFATAIKNEVVAQAIELGVPLGLTYSCNRQSGRHCWECTGCSERAAAFAAAGVPL